MSADVVVGAASGMGAAVARRLAAGSGAPLILADRDVAGAERLAGELEGSGPVEVLRCDLTDPDDLDRLAAATSDRGGLGALVLTAGLSPTMGPGRLLFEVDLLAVDRKSVV